MVLYVVGLGLGGEKDITVRGLEVVKKCALVYLESYTSILGVDKLCLERFYGCKVIEATREFVEQRIDEMLNASKASDIAFLVVGDPFGATTHTDLVIRARKSGVSVEVVHNASIINAVGVVGLQLYRYGQIVSVPFWTDKWRPDSFYDKIKENKNLGLHTLCLLDIKVREQSVENLLRGKEIFEPPRFMLISQCIEQLFQIEEARMEGVFNKNSMCVGVARIGQPNQMVVSGPAEKLARHDFGSPLHSLIICGTLHELEFDYMQYYEIK